MPTLRDLLEPAAACGTVARASSPARPQKWYRGSDIFDPVKVGYQSDGYGYDLKDLFLYDTCILGNSNRGHEGKIYGTELPSADKDAIVEYMKTL